MHWPVRVTRCVALLKGSWNGNGIESWDYLCGALLPDCQWEEESERHKQSVYDYHWNGWDGVAKSWLTWVHEDWWVATCQRHCQLSHTLICVKPVFALVHLFVDLLHRCSWHKIIWLILRFSMGIPPPPSELGTREWSWDDHREVSDWMCVYNK